MAEFLKKNPIALRHCLLYIFLHGESIEEPFDDFCETVGPDVINKKDFQVWFDRFENGNFHVGKQPITNMRDILRSDKNALRVCIFYESLKYKHHEFKKTNKLIHHPAFSVYMHFCKVIGENVMEYREFDFWFYRFSNGVFDLEFERDKNKKIYELMDMPIDIMRNIVAYLGIVDRLSLARTSQSLRSLSQNQKVFHGELAFHVSSGRIYICFGDRDKIKYKNKGDDCEIEFRNGKKVIPGVSYLQQAFQDFKKILENPKIYLQTLTILSWCEDAALFRCIEDALKFTHLLHVQHLSLRTLSMKALLNILPSLMPGYLTTINTNITLGEAKIIKLVEMDQWKQAKYLYMRYHLFCGPLRHLYHFKEFTIDREESFIDDVREMKEILFESPAFEKCALYFDIPGDRVTIMQEFGGAIEGSIDTCHYPIPSSTEYFEIIVSDDVLKIERKKK